MLSEDTCNIDRGRPRVQSDNGLNEYERAIDVEFLAIYVTGIAVCFDDLQRRRVDEATTVNRSDNAVVTIQTADQRDELFSNCLSVGPSGVIVWCHNQWFSLETVEKASRVSRACDWGIQFVPGTSASSGEGVIPA